MQDENVITARTCIFPLRCSHEARGSSPLSSTNLDIDRVLKNTHQAVSQGVRRFGKRSICIICEHLQKPHNAGSRREALFFNTLLKGWPDG